MNIIRFLRNFRVLPYGLPLIWLGTLVAGQSVRADSMTLSETWSDTSVSQATDNGTFSASLTVPGLQNFTSNMWANTSVLLSAPNFVPQVFGDTMGDASTNSPNPNGYGPGSLCTATTATFYITTPDTNGDLVNGFKLTFSRSGNTLSILGQTVAKPTLQPPWSIAALNYLYDPLDPTAFTPHTVNDPNPVQVQVESANGTVTNANFIKTMLITETDTTNSDAFGDILNHVTLSGTTDFTPPTLTDVSPVGNLTVTNGLLQVTVKATTPVSFTNASVANVEFYFNGQDFGPGVGGVSNLWSQILALVPGISTIQTVATDTQNNVSTNTLTVNYINTRTNANLITVSEDLLYFGVSLTPGGDNNSLYQDAGVLDAALSVPAVRNMTDSTWSNLNLSISFGDLQFSNSLSAATSLTTNSATFNFPATKVPGNPVIGEQLIFTRVGGTLLIAAKTSNPNYLFADAPFVADSYEATNGPIEDEKAFTLALTDGTTAAQYAEIDRIIYITGTNTGGPYVPGYSRFLDIQVSGAADFTPPALTNIFPATTTSTTTNGLLNLQVRATDGEDVTNVEFYLNGEDFGPGANGASNIWFQNIALIPGTNMIQAVAADSAGNQSVENFTVNYVNTQTNANEIVFYEHWQDGYVTNSGGAYSFSQDAGVVDAAFTIPALQTMTADTWSNLDLYLAFGPMQPTYESPIGWYFTDFFGVTPFAANLSTAKIVSTNSAIFQFFTLDPFDNYALTEQVTVKRAGINLLLDAELFTPSYDGAGHAFAAEAYLGMAGPITDQQPFQVILMDGYNSSIQYANINRTIFVHGANSITTTNSFTLNNIQISGAADFTPPTITLLSPTISAITTTNALLNVSVLAESALGISNVDFTISGGVNFAAPGLTNLWNGPGSSNAWSFTVPLLPGSNLVQVVAQDTQGNTTTTNLGINYINVQTNADSITVAEIYHELFFNSTSNSTQASVEDASVLNIALSVPALQTMSAETWSNLNISINFGEFNLYGNMSSANILTPTNAVFVFYDTFQRLAIFRVGPKLILTCGQMSDFLSPDASLLLGDPEIPFNGGPFNLQASLAFALTDTSDSFPYVNLNQTIYVSGTNFVITHYPASFLDLSGTADYLPPTITNVFPATTAFTTTNGLLTVQVGAADNIAVSNVEFYVNGEDFGVGANGASNIWFQNIALIPGTNSIQAVAADASGNQSVKKFTVNYFNAQTNANEIAFSEHWQDGYVTNSGGAYSFSQDAGVVDAAFTIPALKSMTSDTWSNLVLSLAFGQTPPATGLPGGGFPVLPYFGGLSLDYVSLSTANILTTNTATFQSFVTNALDNPVLVEQVTIKRVGTNLLLAAELLNPTYNNPPQNFFSALYYGAAGTINDQQPFILSLTDGNNSTQYANIDRPVYIRGTNSITTTNSISLNNIQINGVADFVPPALTNIFPATTTFTTTNGLLTVQVGVADNIAVSNVEFYVDGQDFGPGENVSNSWSQNLALSPGTNIIGTIAVDSSGNASISNVVKVNYINAHTNANLITFFEHLQEYQPIFIFSPGGGYENLYQDAAILNAALSVPLVKNITADTWSNLNLSISFDGLQFNSNLSSATLLTTNSATFDAIANNVEQLVVTRIGGTLLVVAKTSNPNYSFTDVPFVADNYGGIGGNIDDQKSFSLTLADGITSEQYADISRIVYIAGSNSLTASLPISTLSTNFLDNIQITGAADFVPPINQITAPIAGQQWSNNTFVITGKAQDDRAVSNVVYSVNGSDWAPANTGNGFTNWTASVNLIPGTNRITAYACDYDGNFSTTNTVSFRYIPSSPLQIQLAGLGTISPNYSNAVLAIGQNYTVTATHATGFVFTNWVISTNGSPGSQTVTTATLPFTMASNLDLQVNFVDVTRPLLTLSAPTANQRMPSAVATVAGTASDNWKVAGVWYQFNTGLWLPVNTTNGWTNWNTSLTLTAGTNSVKAYALDLGGNYSLTNSVSFFSSNNFALQLAFDTNAPLAANGLRFNLLVSTNLQGHVQYSTNLLNWITLTNFNGTNSTLRFKDSGATNNGPRFYRAIVP